MSLQSPALTASHDHSPILRGVPALITFFHQLNMAARLPKILFTTTAPIFALFRLLSLHWSSRKHEAADAGVRDRRFDRLSCMGLPDSSLEQIAQGRSSHISYGRYASTRLRADQRSQNVSKADMFEAAIQSFSGEAVKLAALIQ